MSQLKNIKYFCVVHDIESLRLGGTDSAEVAIELRNLNYYDSIIVHNDIMKQWLKNNGINKKMISLGIFDYLTDSKPLTTGTHSNRIVYAGNLGKSGFVNALKDINKWSFELYGPNYHQQEFSPNVAWRGEFSPAQIVNEINGDFGLIWDGERVDMMDNILGHYLRFNNPHKFSLYIAAGLPVIVPKEAAVATFVKHHNIGILIDSLYDLQTIVINDEAYAILKKNVVHLQTKVTRGDYFLDALGSVENQLSN